VPVAVLPEASVAVTDTCIGSSSSSSSSSN
jgi:hypothetical protein